MNTIHSNGNPQLKATPFQQDLVQGANGAAPAGQSGGNAPVYLTPDALMAYCQLRLQQIDGQVQQEMAAQTTVNSEQTAVGNLMSMVSNLQGSITNTDSSGNGSVDNATAAANLEQHIEDTIAQIQGSDPNSPLIAQLEQLHDQVMASGTGPLDANGNPATGSTPIAHGYYNGSGAPPGSPPNGSTPPSSATIQDHNNTFTTTELQSFTQTLTNMNSSLNSSAEMGMINIQSQMSQRSTAIQLVTNIMQSYDQSLQGIAGNIGRTS